MQADEECAPDARSEWADDCVSIEVSRARDGAWLYPSRSSGPDGEAEQYSWRFVIVPAVETARDDGYAPLYVAEYVSVDEPGRPLYAVVAPVGVMPAREVRMVGVIDCDDALREGPIPGVEEVHGDDEFERICVAGSRAAVRAAARPLRVGVAGARARPANTCRSALILTLQAAAASWTEERPRLRTRCAGAVEGTGLDAPG